MSSVLLARHPAVDYPTGFCYGASDVGLAAGWEGFADMLGAALRQTGALVLYVSPLQRCARPGVMAAQLAGIPCKFDPRLAEMNFGAWEGQPWDLVPRADLDRWAADLHGFAPPGGENGEALIARVSAFHAEIVPQAAILSHGGPLRVLAALVSGRVPDLAVGSMAVGAIDCCPQANSRDDSAGNA